MPSMQECTKVFLYGLVFFVTIGLPFSSRALAEILLAQEKGRKRHLFKIWYCPGCRCYSATAKQGSAAAYR